MLHMYVAYVSMIYVCIRACIPMYMYICVVPSDDSRYRGVHWSKAPVGRVGCNIHLSLWMYNVAILMDGLML